MRWIAEDAFAAEALRLAFNRCGGLKELFAAARGGRRVYAMWSARDPIPFAAYVLGTFVPRYLQSGTRALFRRRSAIKIAESSV